MKKLIVLILSLVFLSSAAPAQNSQVDTKQYKEYLERANLQEIQLAIDNGAPLSINDAFFYAIKKLDGNKYTEVFKLLIKNGADINGKYCKIRFCDTLVPPITAATSEYIQNATATKILYELLGDVAGSDLNGLSQRESLYSLFFQYGHVDQIRQLLEFCKNLAAEDDDNEDDVKDCIAYIENNIKKEPDPYYLGMTKDQIIEAIGVPVQQLKLTNTKESWIYRASKATANNQKYSGSRISFHIPYTPINFGGTSGTITGGYISDTIDKLTLLFENNIVVASERELSTNKR